MWGMTFGESLRRWGPKERQPMVADTIDPPRLAEAKRVIAETIARLSNDEKVALAECIKAASKAALFAHSEPPKPPGDRERGSYIDSAHSAAPKP